ncbi:delta-aminolevulinic acid dehydratase [Paenibacillus azoreducens]|uniref:delta-aminolevulinic acid dehydratase n=1 Tax=Paenibacillus azoreducens TaxID=116718 RepID=UPI0039F44992
MSKPVMNVALVVGPDTDMDSQAIRMTLEYFGARVFTYWVGRPSDLMSVLSGEDLYADTDMIILNFHGDEGKLIMPELGEDVYDDEEPRGDFGPDEIKRVTKLDGKIVFGNGCSLGEPALAQAFLDGGCQMYIGPDDYPDGNDALMFILRVFYEMIQNEKDIREAYQLARSMNEEMSMFQLYEK